MYERFDRTWNYLAQWIGFNLLTVKMQASDDMYHHLQIEIKTQNADDIPGIDVY
jgi:hypothetical protein